MKMKPCGMQRRPDFLSGVATIPAKNGKAPHPAFALLTDFHPGLSRAESSPGKKFYPVPAKKSRVKSDSALFLAEYHFLKIQV